MRWVQPANQRSTKQSEGVKALRSALLLALGIGVLLLAPALQVQVEADEATGAQSLLPSQGFGQVVEVLDDQTLGGIRGKFVAGGAEEIDTVILWDERPGGFGNRGGGSGSGQGNHQSLGFDNNQITSVTTQRSHSP